MIGGAVGRRGGLIGMVLLPSTTIEDPDVGRTTGMWFTVMVLPSLRVLLPPMMNAEPEVRNGTGVLARVMTPPPSGFEVGTLGLVELPTPIDETSVGRKIGIPLTLMELPGESVFELIRYCDEGDGVAMNVSGPAESVWTEPLPPALIEIAPDEDFIRFDTSGGFSGIMTEFGCTSLTETPGACEGALEETGNTGVSFSMGLRTGGITSGDDAGLSRLN